MAVSVALALLLMAAQLGAEAKTQCSCKEVSEPVCTKDGMQLLNACVAACQGLKDVTRPCEEVDGASIASGTGDPSLARSRASAFVSSGATLGPDVLLRFKEAGYIYLGREANNTYTKSAVATQSVQSDAFEPTAPKKAASGKLYAVQVTSDYHVYVRHVSEDERMNMSFVAATTEGYIASNGSQPPRQQVVHYERDARRLLARNATLDSENPSVRNVVGADDRVQILTEWLFDEYKPITHHIQRYADHEGTCSGSMVGRYTVLTSGYCIRNADGVITQGVTVYAGRTSDTDYVGVAYSQTIGYYVEFKNVVGWHVHHLDIAWILLDRPLGDVSGWKGMHWRCPTDEFWVKVVGYAQERGWATMWRTPYCRPTTPGGSITVGCNDDFWTFSCDTSAGMRGAALADVVLGPNYARGIDIQGYFGDGRANPNVAVPIRPYVLNDVVNAGNNHSPTYTSMYISPPPPALSWVCVKYKRGRCKRWEYK